MYEMTINVILITDIIIEDRMYSFDKPTCSCDTLSLYPIMTNDIDVYKNIIYCYYNSNNKIFNDSPYPARSIMVTLLVFSVVFLMISSTFLIVMCKEKKELPSMIQLI